MALVSYKCPNCGGSVVFDPKKQKFCCEFCMSEFTKEEMEAAALKSTETSGTQEESSAADTAQNNNAGSTKQKELAQETVRNYLIPVPPLAEQRRIVYEVDWLFKILV